MHFVLFSVLFSVSVSVVLKISRHHKIPSDQLIAWNYPAAMLLSYWFVRPEFSGMKVTATHYSLFIPLGILLPFMFLVIAASIQFAGIARTEVAQRISLVIPLLAAFMIFGEQAGSASWAGIGLGLLAVLCSFRWKNGAKHQESRKMPNWVYLIAIFLGMGIIDVLFKQVAQHPSVPYNTSIFLVFTTAFVISACYLGIRFISGRDKMRFSAVPWGLGLGVLNFGNILFYMWAHRAIPENPSIVFTAMNIGVIGLGALVGVLFFRERLSALNYLSLILAAASIIIIAGS